MTTLYLCVTQQHYLPLVVVAAVICGLGVWTAFALGHVARKATSRKQKLGWGLAAAFAAANTIWATHFIAMIAFDPGLPLRFEIARTVLSYVVALGMVGASCCIIGAFPSIAGRVVGGTIGGLAISAMHYTGMSAVQTQGHLIWSPVAVAASISAGIALSILAALLPLSRVRGLRLAAPLALILAVCLDHFIAMSAVAIVFDPSAEQPGGGINLTVLAVIVANVAFAILGLSVAAIWLRTRDRRQLAAEEARMGDLADISIEGLLICEGDRVVASNKSLETMLGLDRARILGQRLEALIPQLKEGATIEAERDATLQGGDGAIPVKVMSKEISIAGKPRTVVAVRDQRERLSTEQAMRRLAHQDTLTGLANRLNFNNDVSERINSRREAGRHFALFMLDLDRFKIVNDTLGHGVGDELLKRVARRLGKAIRNDDLLARLGGDEFAVVLTGARQPSDVTEVADRIIEMIGRPFLIEGRIIDVGVSIGIAFAPGDGTSVEALSRSADLALYRAKEEGRGVFRFFEEEMNARMQARRSFERDLRRAIAQHELYVVYQPQIESKTGRFDGAEALVRWLHPRKGNIPPCDFIPLAEDLGLIGALGEYVLRRACAEAARWPSHLTVAVNLSPLQLRDHRFPSTVAKILAETGLPGSRLELELTENALLQDDGRTIGVLHSLRALGIRISMDDFGTGYSSISYLRRFPFDKIKIDQSFVRQLPHDTESTAIVQAVATLGAQLGMKVTAEGVETLDQQLFVTTKGCHQLQGYLFSKPIDAESTSALFAGTIDPANSAAA